jgi:hypothetical protein
VNFQQAILMVVKTIIFGWKETDEAGLLPMVILLKYSKFSIKELYGFKFAK